MGPLGWRLRHLGPTGMPATAARCYLSCACCWAPAPPTPPRTHAHTQHTQPQTHHQRCSPPAVETYASGAPKQRKRKAPAEEEAAEGEAAEAEGDAKKAKAEEEGEGEGDE